MTISYSSLKAKTNRVFNNLHALVNSEKRELLRLSKLSRYSPTKTTFYNKEIKIVDNITFLSGAKEIFEKDIYKLKIGKKDNPVIVDCGANIGLSVMYFKKTYPNAIIKAYEPDPEIFEVLKYNVKAFDPSGIELNQKAIWKDNSGIEFLQEGGFSGRIPKEGDSKKTVNVPTERLRDVLMDMKLIDLLKIDIEGAEYEVLLDIRNNLSNVKNIFIEYHSHVKEPQTLHEILQILHENKFRYHIQEAFVRNQPFTDRNTMLGMDLQLNIFGYRDGV